jgi:hypothetical protein
MQVSIVDQDFLQELFAALLLEGVQRQSGEEARDLAARLVTEARTPPDHATAVTAAAETLIRVRTLLRQRKRWPLSTNVDGCFLSSTSSTLPRGVVDSLSLPYH